MKFYLTMAAAVLLMFCSQAQSMGDKYPFASEADSQLFFELTKELRCPKCQNQNIADSDAMIAVDLKRKVHELILEGYDRQQVIDFMKQRYGDFVYYQPPLNPMTIWLWILPALFVVLTLIGVAVSRKRTAVIIDEAQLKKAQALLESES
jgi:cytochrome c-type biogenesis protein CcmH